MSKYLKKFNLTGPCELNIDLIIKDWKRINHLWSISQWHSDFRLVRLLKKNSSCTTLKVAISTTEAYLIINKLDLKRIRSTIFRDAATWKIER